MTRRKSHAHESTDEAQEHPPVEQPYDPIKAALTEVREQLVAGDGVKFCRAVDTLRAVAGDGLANILADCPAIWQEHFMPGARGNPGLVDALRNKIDAQLQ